MPDSDEHQDGSSHQSSHERWMDVIEYAQAICSCGWRGELTDHEEAWQQFHAHEKSHARQLGLECQVSRGGVDVSLSRSGSMTDFAAEGDRLHALSAANEDVFGVEFAEWAEDNWPAIAAALRERDALRVRAETAEADAAMWKQRWSVAVDAHIAAAHAAV